MIRALAPNTLDVAEVSGKWEQIFDFPSYERLLYPKHDIYAGPFTGEGGNPRKVHPIIDNQIQEHLNRPFCSRQYPDQYTVKYGHSRLAAPCFVPFHAAPTDNSRCSAR